MDSSLIVAIIVAILGSGSVSALVNAWIEKRKEKNKNKIDPVTIGVRLLLQDRIEGLCIKYVKEGEIRWENLKYLRQAHDCYHNKLGGNGDLTDLMDSVEHLPVSYPPKK